MKTGALRFLWIRLGNISESFARISSIIAPYDSATFLVELQCTSKFRVRTLCRSGHSTPSYSRSFDAWNLSAALMLSVRAFSSLFRSFSDSLDRSRYL
jgi:hypothetical protein